MEKSVTSNHGFLAEHRKGEALTDGNGYKSSQIIPPVPQEDGDDFDPKPGWHVLWTRSNCEQLVYEQLVAKGFELFLPTIDIWARSRGIRYLRRASLFPGYLFIYRAMDKASYLEVCKARGLVRLLGERWDKLAVVPGRQIESIQKVMQADMPRISHAYLREGQAVRITSGPLANVEGILVKSEPKKGLLVLSIDLLRQSVAVEVDCTIVAAG